MVEDFQFQSPVKLAVFHYTVDLVRKLVLVVIIAARGEKLFLAQYILAFVANFLSIVHYFLSRPFKGQHYTL